MVRRCVIPFRHHSCDDVLQLRWGELHRPGERDLVRLSRCLKLRGLGLRGMGRALSLLSRCCLQRGLLLRLLSQLPDLLNLLRPSAIQVRCVALHGVTPKGRATKGQRKREGKLSWKPQHQPSTH